ncbi:MAG: hypothetical protein JHC71_16085, partial [Blastococcus sp.]|nr:hypothetical protein [Blastococcus sp.]
MRPTALRLAAVLLAVLCGLAGCGSDPGPRSSGAGASDTSSTSSPSTSTSPSAEPAPTTPAPGGDLEQQVTAALDGLDRGARIAQLFVVGVPADQQE